MVEKRKLLFLTLNYYWMDTEGFLKSTDRIALLRTHDMLPPGEYFHRLDYKTFLIDLRRSTEQLLSSLDYKSARYPINRALKSGIAVKFAEDRPEKERFFRFYQDFIEGPGHRNQVLALQQDELERLVVLYAVSSQGEYLGGIGLLPSPDGRYLLYKYSATKRRFCENDLLVWQAILHAKEAGYTYFDMSWMGNVDGSDDKQRRLFQYKKKFGGELVPFYSYVKVRGVLKIPGLFFKIILKRLFKDDINNLALLLKRTWIFR